MENETDNVHKISQKVVPLDKSEISHGHRQYLYKTLPQLFCNADLKI